MHLDTGQRGYDVAVGGDPNGNGWSMTNHPSSRALLLAFLKKLRQTEGISRSWQTLQSLDAELEGMATAMLDALEANTITVEASLRALDKSVGVWRSVLQTMAESDSADAQTWRDALRASANEAFGQDNGQARADALLAGDAPLLRAVELGRSSATEAQSAFVLACTAGLATACRLSWLAAYLAVATQQEDIDEPPAPLDPETVDWMTALAAETAAFVDDRFAGLHGTVADEETSPEVVGTLARDILDQSKPRGLVIAETLGVLSHQGTPPELLPNLGPAALSLAQASARLQLLVAYAAHVLVNSRSLAANAWLARERASATSELASHVPAGAAVGIEQLSAIELDTLVEVQGRVETLSIDHDPAPPKFSTFVQLRAFDGRAVVRVRAHMFSLEKNGLREGACCKIRGFVRRGKSWLSDDETGLDIDRVSLSSLQKHSWLDGVAYRMRPFYRLYQDEMNMFNTPGGV